jgi:rhodanese-related sulfurtransferase
VNLKSTPEAKKPVPAITSDVYGNIKPIQLTKILADPNQPYTIIDVRMDNEIAHGKIENALTIDFLANDFEKKITQLDKNKKYIIYCKVGGRSEKALKLMKDQGFKEVHNLEGGYVAYRSLMK